jgi:hypothetical protein
VSRGLFVVRMVVLGDRVDQTGRAVAAVGIYETLARPIRKTGLKQTRALFDRPTVVASFRDNVDSLDVVLPTSAT